jgi:RHS repeat-associated protein
MPTRTWDNGSKYRYRFNGQERSDEIKGEANSYTAEYWEYDPRIGRRWNQDPVKNPSESPYAAFSNNPIYMVDPIGTTAVSHEVKKGETLSSIAKKHGTTVGLIAKINNIKDPNKIQIGQVLTVGVLPSAEDSHMRYGSPEQDFSSNPLTGYNNPTNNQFSYNVTATVGELSTEFASNLGSLPSFQNTIILGGPILEEIKRLPTVRDLIRQGIDQLNSDKTLTPGEYFIGNFRMSSITGKDGQRILGQSITDIFSDKKLRDNKFFSAENWLGSYGFSMRVTGDGKVVIAVYDSKTMASATDRRETLRGMVPELSATYQRYIWSLNINDVKKPETTYEK